MRMIVFGTAIAGAAMIVTACSQGKEDAGNSSAAAEPATNASAPAQDAGVATAGAAVLNANDATAAQLAGVEGLSAEAAQAVVAGRPYATVLDLNARLRSTLTEEQAEAVLARVFVPVNLNSARREEIELIPGMSSR